MKLKKKKEKDFNHTSGKDEKACSKQKSGHIYNCWNFISAQTLWIWDMLTQKGTKSVDLTKCKYKKDSVKDTAFSHDTMLMATVNFSYVWKFGRCTQSFSKFLLEQKEIKSLKIIIEDKPLFCFQK